MTSIQTHEATKVSVWLIAAVSAFSGLLFGYDTVREVQCSRLPSCGMFSSRCTRVTQGVISGALLQITDDLALDSFGQEMVVSATVAAAVLGSVSASLAGRVFGRRGAVMETAIVFIAGAIVMGLSQSLWDLVLGRAVVGFAIGQASMIAPLYLSEVAPPSLRGALVVLNVLFLTGGQCLAGIIDALLLQVPHGWRWMLGVSAVPAALQLVGCLFLPESPRWLVAAGRVEEARQVLRAVYAGAPPAHYAPLAVQEEGQSPPPPDGLEGELQSMLAEAAAARAAQGNPAPHYSIPTLCGCRQPGEGAKAARAKVAVGRWALSVACGIQALQQVCGINIGMYFGGRVLQQAGFPSHTAVWLAAALAGMNCLCTLLALKWVDRVGRRPLLLASMAAVVVVLAGLGGLFAWREALTPRTLRTLGVIPTGGWNASATTGGNRTEVLLEPTQHCAADSIASCAQCTLRPQCGFWGDATHGVCLAVSGANRVPVSGSGLPVPASGAFGLPKVHGAWHDTVCPGEGLHEVGWGVFVGILALLAVYSPGMGSVAWVLSSEVTPAPLRSAGLSAAATSNWLTNLLVSATFLPLLQSLSPAGTFWLYGALVLAGLVWGWLCIPETKGVPLEATEAMLLRVLEKQRPLAG